MNTEDKIISFREALGKKKQTVLTVIFLFLIIATIFTFLTPFQYEAKSRVLIIQSFPSGIDPYTASKSNEYLSTVLSEIVSANLFFNEVLSAGFNIEKKYFPEEPVKQMEKWQSSVIASPVNDTGIINIKVFHTDRNQADQIIRAVNHVLKSKHKSYHGIGDNVALRIIDQPITSNKPVKPNIALNLAVAFITGLVSALSFVYLFPEEKYALRLLGKQTIKNNELEYTGTLVSDIPKETLEVKMEQTPSYEQTVKTDVISEPKVEFREHVATMIDETGKERIINKQTEILNNDQAVSGNVYEAPVVVKKEDVDQESTGEVMHQGILEKIMEQQRQKKEILEQDDHESQREVDANDIKETEVCPETIKGNMKNIFDQTDL